MLFSYKKAQRDENDYSCEYSAGPERCFSLWNRNIATDTNSALTFVSPALGNMAVYCMVRVSTTTRHPTSIVLINPTRCFRSYTPFPEIFGPHPRTR
jgi:hypothetical protein